MKTNRHIFLSLIFMFSISQINAQKISSIIYPLDSFSLNTDVNWLSKIFDSKISDSLKLVGIGEVLHGGKEISAFKSKMVQYLIEKRGCRMFLFEYPNASLSLLNYYLQNRQYTNIDTLKLIAYNALNGSLYDQSFIDLLVWIKKFNLTHFNDTVTLKGVDISGASGSFSNYFMYNFSALLDGNTKKKIDDEWSKVPVDTITQQLITWYYANKESVQAKLKSHFDVLAYNIKNAELNLAHTLIQKENFYKASFFRDSIMAKNIEEFTHKKSIFWSHNLHVTPSNNYGCGSILKKDLKDQYYTIVTDFSENAKARIKKPPEIIEKNFSPDKSTFGYRLLKKYDIAEGVVFYNDIRKMKNMNPFFGNIDIAGSYHLAGSGKCFDALVILRQITLSELEK